LQKMGLGVQSVLLVQVPNRIIIERLAGRRTCKNCGALFHLNFNPSTREGVCDRCGGELQQRGGDLEENVSAGLKVYENQTAPLIDYYRQRGILREIDGVGSVDEIGKRLIKAVEEPAT